MGGGAGCGEQHPAGALGQGRSHRNTHGGCGVDLTGGHKLLGFHQVPVFAVFSGIFMTFFYFLLSYVHLVLDSFLLIILFFSLFFLSFSFA